MTIDLKPGSHVLLFASYCGGDNDNCSDLRPCADCLGMSNVCILDEGVQATYARTLGSPDISKSHEAYVFGRVREMFDTDVVAGQFLREDGEGGLSSGIYRMAREIERLRAKCGEPNERPDGWEDEEDDRIDAEFDAEQELLHGHHAETKVGYDWKAVPPTSTEVDIAKGIIGFRNWLNGIADAVQRGAALANEVDQAAQKRMRQETFGSSRLGTARTASSGEKSKGGNA